MSAERPDDSLPAASAAVVAWRARMGWSQRQAAEAIGLPLNGYQEIERGRAFATGKPRGVRRPILLACAALEHGLEPLEK